MDLWFLRIPTGSAIDILALQLNGLSWFQFIVWWSNNFVFGCSSYVTRGFAAYFFISTAFGARQGQVTNVAGITDFSRWKGSIWWTRDMRELYSFGHIEIAAATAAHIGR